MNLVVPYGLPSPRKIEGAVPGTGLLMIHPVSYLALLWGKEKRNLSIKEFLFRHTPLPQTYYLDYPDYTIRIEWYKNDLEKHSVSFLLDTPTIPNIELCLTSSAYVRRMYKRDYDLGDYE